MLYVSTRSKTDSYTAYRALHEDRAPDGGMFVPFRLPHITAEELCTLKEKSFSEIVAQILNIFFSQQMNGWDVEFCIGRYPFKLGMMSQRVSIAELWHNTEATYMHMVQSLYEKLGAKGTVCRTAPQWFRIAVEIAVLFGLYGELNRRGYDTIDIAVTSGDFIYPIAAWYARQMGLPVECIICGCSENGCVWDFLHRGEITANATVTHTSLPALDVSVPVCFERLIYGVFGVSEVERYLDACKEHSTYYLSEESLACLNQGMFAAVIGSNRVDSVISSIYRTNAYLADPLTALSYGALQDYRSHTGENRHTLLLSRSSPILSAERIASAIGCSQEKLKAMVHLSKE